MNGPIILLFYLFMKFMPKLGVNKKIFQINVRADTLCKFEAEAV